jgi:hypothetical protein
MRIGAISNWLAASLMNATLRNTPYTTPATVYLALYTTDPTKADTGTEVTGGAYARIPITLTAPTIMQDVSIPAEPVDITVCENTTDLIFPKATAYWGTVGWVAIRDALTGGNCLWQGPLENPKIVETDDLMVFLAGDLKVGLN